ncbi:DUF4817 domain-containing protein [Trichonephila clavipes]|nr:DUF4817 domain-containing protein [Trichonephila clavipes]
MITNFSIPELNNHDVQELWFQQDGATCHTARATIDLLKDTFGDRLISRFGRPRFSPPRSCDLTPLDYFLWSYVKSLVYADKPQTLDHLEDNIPVLLPIYGHKCWKKSSKIGRADWTTSEPAVAVICQKSYLKYKFDDDIQKVTPARAPLAFSLLSNSALMSKSFSFDLLRLRAKTAWLWLPQSASLTVRCPQRYVHRDQRRI